MGFTRSISITLPNDVWKKIDSQAVRERTFVERIISGILNRRFGSDEPTLWDTIRHQSESTLLVKRVFVEKFGNVFSGRDVFEMLSLSQPTINLALRNLMDSGCLKLAPVPEGVRFMKHYTATPQAILEALYDPQFDEGERIDSALQILEDKAPHLLRDLPSRLRGKVGSKFRKWLPEHTPTPDEPQTTHPSEVTEVEEPETRPLSEHQTKAIASLVANARIDPEGSPEPTSSPSPSLFSQALASAADLGDDHDTDESDTDATGLDVD